MQRESFIAQSHLGSKSNIADSEVISMHTESQGKEKQLKSKRVHDP